MFGRASEVSRFHQYLLAGDHRRAMRLFDEISGDPAQCALVLDSVLMSDANHSDPQLHTPHGLPTTEAARAMLGISGFPAGVPLLRFATLYSFSLRKRDLSAEDVRIKAKSLPAMDDPVAVLYRAFETGDFPAAGAVLARIALDHGLDAAAHAALRWALNDLGKLGHHLALAVAYVEAARALGLPRGLLPIANLGFYLAESMQGVKPVPIEPLDAPAAGSGDRLAAALDEGDFGAVESELRGLLGAGRTDEAVRPLLIAASADPGFLGHTLILAHSLRLAAPRLAPAETFHVFWKLYRTSVTRFGYPDFLRPGPASGADRESVLEALQSSLRYKSPPAEATLRQAIEAGVPLDEVLGTIVGAYGHWTVGEKEHTIAYLAAALETARFLGRDEALLPLAVALMRLPF